ncbi:MAG: multimeric flavodoxin WrbA [Candidatus Azotimanducaceae bacterium]
MKIAEAIYQANGVKTEIVRPVDFEIAAGLEKDYTGRDGYSKDDWPQLQAKVDACDILIIGTSVWFGEKSSVCNRVLERMYGYTHSFNDRGQYRNYGKVGATLITGNEDGVKHCAMNILFSLSHIGYTARWLKDAGGFLAHGNQPEVWDAGCHTDFHSPEHKR